jgi:hypothetical protein
MLVEQTVDSLVARKAAMMAERKAEQMVEMKVVMSVDPMGSTKVGLSVGQSADTTVEK